MDANELILLKEMVKDVVRSVLQEELAKIKPPTDTYKKDLKEIKLLVAGMIKENRQRGGGSKSPGNSLTEETRTGLSDIFNKANQMSKIRAAASHNPVVQNIANNVDKLEAPASIKNVLMETTMEMVNGGVSAPEDLGAGEFLTDDAWATGPEENPVNVDYGEIEEAYESKLPDFTTALQQRFSK